MQVPSLGREDPLEKETATHSSILAWRIPWTQECGRLYSMGSRRVGHDRVTEHARVHLRDHIADTSCSSLCLTPRGDGGSHSGLPVLTEHVSCHVEEACFLTSPRVPALPATLVPSPVLGRSPSSGARPHLGCLGHVSVGAGPSWASRGSSRHRNSQAQDSLLADTTPSAYCFLLLLLLLMCFKLINFIFGCAGSSLL